MRHHGVPRSGEGDVAHDAALVVVHVAKGRRQVWLDLLGGPVEALGSGVCPRTAAEPRGFEVASSSSRL